MAGQDRLVTKDNKIHRARIVGTKASSWASTFPLCHKHVHRGPHVRILAEHSPGFRIFTSIRGGQVEQAPAV